MSSYRRQPTSEPIQDKFRSKASQLQEAFPTWSSEDLVSLLAEVNGDIQLAATRISDGHAEQWGSVTRKKDKKPASSVSAESKERFSGKDRTDHRGGRVGRGSSRGGGRGAAGFRGSHRSTNGHRSILAAAATTEQTSTVWGASDAVNPAIATVTDEGAGGPHSTTILDSDHNERAEPYADAAGTSTSVTDIHVNGSGSVSFQSLPAPAPAPVPSKAAKTPANSKLSWAQIARPPQEKPATTPGLSYAPSLPQSTVPILSSKTGQSDSAPHSTETATSESQPGWEEPTTIQQPVWDDEPQLKAQTVHTDVWPLVSTPSLDEQPRDEGSSIDVNEPQTSRTREQILSAFPMQLQQLESSRSSTPSAGVKRLSSTIHRSSTRLKTSDQAVVMPISNFPTATEKIGMQFGSLTLAGDDVVDSDGSAASATAGRSSEVEVSLESKQSSQPVQMSQPSHELPSSESPVLTSTVSPSKVQTPLITSTVGLLHTTISSQGQQTNQPPQQSQQHSLPSSLSQPSMPSQSSSSSISSPITSSFSQQSQAASQPTLVNHHHPPQQHPGSQNQGPVHSQYMQHGLPTHLDLAANQLQHSPHAPQAQQQVTTASAGHSSYFRQHEATYFNTPTPPAGQQDNPYGTFGQVGQQMHQPQSSHGGFNADYSYNDVRNNFYDSYQAQGAFAGRNTLGHDELKGLTAPQQSHASAVLPPSNTQSSQQSSQTGLQSPPASTQGPQQGYPHPMQYYFPFPQNQYYGSPYNSGYGVPQPFVKYPAMFQAGPPGPGSAPSPVTKQASNTAQHSNPYGQSLYGQQHPSNAYDDVGYQHHSQHGHGQNVGTGLPGNDYPKQLYGGHGGHGQGIQGFMSGLGQSAGGPNSAGAGSGGPQGSKSPETPFKPYGPGKDMSIGVGQSVGQAGPPGRLGGQQPVPGGGFYGSGAGRFGGNVSATAGAGPQVQQSQQHQQGPVPQLGYPQSGSDGNSFYSYQRGQQYWQ